MMTRSAKDIWEGALRELRLQVTRPNYETWLKDTVGVDYQGENFIVGVPNAFASDWLQRRLHSLVKKTLVGIIAHPVDVKFAVHEGQKGAESNTLPRVNSPRLSPRYTFSSFIVGSCNRLAHAAALGVAENPGKGYNPLFV